jgi:hypothetical protein
MSAVAVEDKIEQLLACLDKDAQHIQQSLSQLNQLRALVIKRDDAALSKLLESISDEAGDRSRQQQDRQSVRRDLANALGCDLEQMTLSSLQERLPQAEAERISRMRAKLKGLVAELRKEYLSTVMLVSECSRLNNLLLRSIFNIAGAGEVFYNANGMVRRQNDTAFVNLKL